MLGIINMDQLEGSDAEETLEKSPAQSSSLKMHSIKHFFRSPTSKSSENMSQLRREGLENSTSIIDVDKEQKIKNKQCEILDDSLRKVNGKSMKKEINPVICAEVNDGKEERTSLKIDIDNSKENKKINKQNGIIHDIPEESVLEISYEDFINTQTTKGIVSEVKPYENDNLQMKDHSDKVDENKMVCQTTEVLDDKEQVKNVIEDSKRSRQKQNKVMIKKGKELTERGISNCGGNSENQETSKEEQIRNIVRGKGEGNLSVKTNIQKEHKQKIPSAKPKPKDITQFFKTLERKTTAAEKKDSETWLVMAEVHTETSPKSSPIQSPDDSSQLRNVRKKVNSNCIVDCTREDLLITHLESHSLTLREKRLKKKNEVKQGQIEKINDDEKTYSKQPDSSLTVKPTNPKMVVNKGKNKDGEELVNNIEDSDDDMKKEIALVKTATLDNVKIPSQKNQMQTKLSFGQEGFLQTVKSPKQSSKNTSVQKTSASKARNRKVIKLNKEDTPQKEIRKTLVKVIVPPKKKTKRKNSKAVALKNKVEDIMDNDEEDTSDNEEEESDKEDTENMSPRKRHVYVVHQQSKKGKELKMKFTKVKNINTGVPSSSSEEDDVLRIIRRSKALVVIAQKLVQNARINNGKSKNIHRKNKCHSSKMRKESPQPDKKISISSESDNVSLRRSSRHSAQVATIAISECLDAPERQSRKRIKVLGEQAGGDEIPDDEKVTSVLKKVPRKQENISKPKKKAKSPKKLPKKRMAVRLASIFGKETNQSSDDNDDVKIMEVECDPKISTVRRAFLMSGIPEELRKQKNANDTCVLSQYAPWPIVSHVQQRDTSDKITFNPWNLKEVILSMRKEDHRKCDLVDCHFNILNRKENKPALLVNTEFTGYVELDAEMVRYLLAEIHAFNPSYPVRRTYKQLVRKYKEAKGKLDQELSNNTSGDQKRMAITWPENVKCKGQKRKLDLNSGEETNMRRKSKRQRGDLNEADSVRQSTRRKISDVDSKDCKIIESCTGDVHQQDKEEKELPRMQWTETYQPQNCVEMLGNSKVASKLKTWLSEWKHCTDLEIKKMKKQLKIAAKKGRTSEEEIRKKFGSDWWMDDDSDFELDNCDDDSDYEVADDCLCNTMLVTGPHGVGKTAMVYALAKELGYKVFEVNTSSKRSGRQLLAQLQEATQSHQVGRENLDAMFTTFRQIELRKDEKGRPEKKMPPSFANFFSKGDKVISVESQLKGKKKKEVKGQIEGKKARAKVCQNKLEVSTPPGTTNSTNKGLNLSSTSLILFEEVDLVFEDDRGFWTAIQTFMNTTKRPIILTASSHHVSQFIESRHETLGMKQAPLLNITSYLQLVCLAENMRTDFHDIQTLVECCNGDLRRVMLMLQFWAESGGGAHQLDKPVKYLPKFFAIRSDIVASNPSQDLPLKRTALPVLDTSMNSADDFTPVKKCGSRKARLILGDDSDVSLASPVKLVSNITGSCNEDSRSSQDGAIGHGLAHDSQVLTLPSDTNLATADVAAPAMHMMCFNSCIGCKIESEQDVAPNIMCFCLPNVLHYKSMGVDVVYSNLPQILHLPHHEVNLSTLLHTDSLVQTRYKRIKHTDDIFDSEDDSDDNSVVLKDRQNQVVENVALKHEEIKERRKLTPADKIAGDAVTALSKMYDCFSYADSYISQVDREKEGPCLREHHFSSGLVSAGLTDHDTTWDEPDWWKCSYMHDIMSYIDVTNIQSTNQALDCLMEEKDKLNQDENEKFGQIMSVPISKEDLNSQRVKLCPDTFEQKSASSSYLHALRTVRDSLPLVAQSVGRNIPVDVMPTLRIMSRFEQGRQITNTKRRFMHYFETISLGLVRKEQVMDTLCSSFH